MALALALMLPSALCFAQASTVRFDIDRFKIEGNTLLAPDEIEAGLKPFTGKQRESADIPRAMETLRQLYRRAGFSVVWVVAPEQDLDQGGVRVKLGHSRSNTRK